MEDTDMIDYKGFKVELDPETLETVIYLYPEGEGLEPDRLILTPEQSDELSGALIMANANRKKLRMARKTDGLTARFRRNPKV